MKCEECNGKGSVLTRSYPVPTGQADMKNCWNCKNLGSIKDGLKCPISSFCCRGEWGDYPDEWQPKESN